VVANRSGQKAYDRICDRQRGGLSPRQNEVSERQLLRGQMLGDTVVYILIVSAEESKLRLNGVSNCINVGEPSAARREKYDRSLRRK